jgi:beta-glucosidase
MFAIAIDAWGRASEVDMAAHNEIALDEGADVGYRWFAKIGERPLYALGHGLTYTIFDYSDLEISGCETITATFTVTIIGDRDGADVPQLYLIQAAGDIL